MSISSDFQSVWKGLLVGPSESILNISHPVRHFELI